jgi:protein-S-isoprenylcysteine O-methyltransferase Ste14
MTPATHLMLLAVAWIVYGLVHSGLASPVSKAWFRRHFPRHFPAYRVAFNVIAVALLAPPLWLLISYPGEPLWQWPLAARWLADAAALAAAAGFVWTFRIYDGRELLGIMQLRRARQATGEQAPDLDRSPMQLSWAHRFVRHPWYFFGLVIVWTREMNAALLITAGCLTIYLLLGSRREERDLLARYGERYRYYRERVPALMPLPWRYLSREQAERLRRGAWRL